MKDKTTPALFSIVREAANKLWAAENGNEVRAALGELERRMLGGKPEDELELREYRSEGRHLRQTSEILGKLSRLQEDLDAFKKSHAEHVHRYQRGAHVSRTDVPTHDPGPLPGGVSPEDAKNTDDPFHPYKIQDMRDNAENRAWAAITEWTESVKDHDVPHVRIGRTSNGGYYAALWHRGLQDQVKLGTSRLDALAHLATWCQEDMHPAVVVERCPSDCCKAEGWSRKCGLSKGHEGPHKFG